MSLLYGKRSSAFTKLRGKIMKDSTNQSLFAWSVPTKEHEKDGIYITILACHMEGHVRLIGITLSTFHLQKKRYSSEMLVRGSLRILWI